MFFYRDRVTLTLRAGAGGKGACSFHRTKKIARGGPDGGDGGRGGDVFFQADPRYYDFSHFKKKRSFHAERGLSGENQNKTGLNGEAIKVQVPLGTVVRDHKSKLLLDLKKQKLTCFLKGGLGGKGNTFYKNSLNQAPRQFQKGLDGEEKKVILEFKPLVEVALIGQANSGKSTFLNTVTKASSPVASYPYTTLVPFLGQVPKGGYTIADIPGLSTGASKEEDKGLSFLRLIQRAKLLLHFIDVSSLDPLLDKQQIEKEIQNFDTQFSETHFSNLSYKKRFLVFSKIDRMDDQKFLERLKQKLNPDKKLKEFSISCLNKKGVEELLLACKTSLSDE